MKISSALFSIFVLSMLAACSSRVSKPEPTPQEDPSVSALSKNNNREVFLNKFLQTRASSIKSLGATSVRVRETEASEMEGAEGTFALVSLSKEGQGDVGPASVYYFAKDRSALKIDDMAVGLELYLEQTGPQNAKLSAALQVSPDEGLTEIFLLTPYSARVISNKSYDLTQARDKAAFNRFKRSWKELTNTWSCVIKSPEEPVCR